MKLIFGFFLALAAGDKLDNTYLPPSHAGTSGGDGNFLTAPLNSYNAPRGSIEQNAPSAHYGTAEYNHGGLIGKGISLSKDSQAAILKFNNENDGHGSYRFDYQTDNEITHQESGELRNIGKEQAVVAQGSYSYTGPDGVQYTVTYIADENGFHASGDHLPTPPPIPEAIQKSLDLIAASGNQNYHSNGYQNENRFAEVKNRQYLTPNKPSFNHNTGYNY